MSADMLRVEGVLYLSLETVAELYRVEVVLLREVYELGLLGRGVAGGGGGATVCIAAAELDRVATVVRLQRVLGHDVDAICVHLELFSAG